MPSRYKSRQTALQMLYLRDMRGEALPELFSSYYGSLASEDAEPVPERDPFAEELVEGATQKQEEIDRLIEQHSQNWRIGRMATVDRNILRLAAYELIALQTPGPVVIDQAIELATRFSAPESFGFLNGVLDAITRAVRGTTTS